MTGADDSILDTAELVIALYFVVCLVFGLITTASVLIVFYKKKYGYNCLVCLGALL